MEHPIFIHGDTISFSTRLLRPNGVSYEVDLDSLYTPYGFLVPLNADSLFILDAFDHGASSVLMYDRISWSIFIEHNGKVSDVILGADSIDGPVQAVQLVKRRILPSQKSIMARAGGGAESERSQACAEISKDISAAVELYNATSIVTDNRRHFLSISEIAKQLKERSYTASWSNIPNQQ